jgi:diguanylate cyclase (GGDEF)-like protein
MSGDDQIAVSWRPSALSGSTSVFAPTQTASTKRAVARLRHEYSLRDKLNDAWALMPRSLGESGDAVKLVLADTDGQRLEDFLAAKSCNGKLGGHLDIAACLSLAIDIADALEKMHVAGILHKDIRPANIIIKPHDGGARFTGFGYASSFPRLRQAPEPVESIDGSLAYMAPEQTGRMNRSVDNRADLYALGVSLYELFCGRRPFLSDDPVEMVHFHVALPPVPPADVRVDMPKGISDVLMKLLAKAAENRYQTAAGLLSDLRLCLTAWREKGDVPAFPLAENDHPNRLHVPEKLYGREGELTTLLEAAKRVTEQGRFEIVLVSGYSGIGKSSLVGELHKVLIEPRALFASGKFDQFKRHIPYATLAQAFQGLVRGILGRSDEHLRIWSDRIRDAVGANGRLLTDLVPELGLLIGTQPDLPDLPPNDAQARFFNTLRHFLSVWATAEHPLVLFLDDLQWVDPGSMKFLEYLAAQGDLGHLLLICAYRDNEVDATHPFALTVEAIKGHRPVESIELAPLPPPSLALMVSEALRCTPAHAAPLIDVIAGKTAGNPFFTIQFLEGLYEDGVLKPCGRGWCWDDAEIAGKEFTDNVIELMVKKICRLPEKCRDALRRLAFLGNTVPLERLARLNGSSADALEADLDAAFAGTFLTQRAGTVRFSHDRIQEAAYSLLPAEEREAEHLGIGRRLIADLGVEANDKDVFEVVNHFNRGLRLVVDPDERLHVCRLNVLAGHKAKAAAAYATARTYFAQAADLLSADAWGTDYEETARLYLVWSSCELLAGNHHEVDRLLPLILSRARSNVDRAKACRQQILRNQVAGRNGDGVDAALEALRLFGLVCPGRQNEVDFQVRALRGDVAARLGEGGIPALIDAPAMIDEDALALLGILVDAMPCAYMGRTELYAWLVLNALKVTLDHGNTADSCAVYMGYAIVLVSMYDEIADSVAYADLALKLQEKLRRPDLKGRILVRNGVFINSRLNPLQSSIDILREGFVDCQNAADYAYASYAALEIAWLTFERGAPLADFASTAAKYVGFAEKSRNLGLLATLQAETSFVSVLQGGTSFDEFVAAVGGFEESLTQAKHNVGKGYLMMMGALAALLAGDARQAFERIEDASSSLKSLTGWVGETTYHFLAALILSSLDGPEFRRECPDVEARLNTHLDLLEARAKESPVNFRSRFLLAKAEAARIRNDAVVARSLFEDAIKAAHESAAVHIEALAYQRAAGFYAQGGFALIAETYLAKARDLYDQWGAHMMVARLDSTLGPHPRTDAAGLVQSLDALSVIKASQAVSGEIALDRLIQTLMRITIENAGADRGVLVVNLAGQPMVVAEARVGNNSVAVEILSQTIAETAFPLSVVNFALRTQDKVLLDDARKAPDFGADPHFAGGSVRSVLCQPLVKQSRLIGLLYLENSQVSHAFTTHHVLVLDLLASQAAISIENALLYDNLERTVAQRTAELREKKEQLDEILAEQEIILENASLGIVVVMPDKNGARVISRANRAAERLFGYPSGGMVGLETRVAWPTEAEFNAVGDAYKMLARGETYVGEHPIRRGALENGFGRLVGAAIDHRDLSKGTIWLVEDITERKLNQEKIHRLAMTDHLTGLANRAHFHARFKEYLKLARREEKNIALLLLDLDRFKPVNDTFGHVVGDELLKSVASTFLHDTRETDLVARLGGDEFAIILVNPENGDAAARISQRIINDISQGLTVLGHDVRIGISIGIAMYPKDGLDQDDLIQKADTALYESKREGRNTFRFYQPKQG